MDESQVIYEGVPSGAGLLDPPDVGENEVVVTTQSKLSMVIQGLMMGF